MQTPARREPNGDQEVRYWVPKHAGGVRMFLRPKALLATNPVAALGSLPGRKLSQVEDRAEGASLTVFFIYGCRPHRLPAIMLVDMVPD